MVQRKADSLLSYHNNAPFVISARRFAGQSRNSRRTKPARFSANSRQYLPLSWAVWKTASIMSAPPSQPNADGQRAVNVLHILAAKCACVVLQAALIDCPYLLQQRNGIMCKAGARAQKAMCGQSRFRGSAGDGGNNDSGAVPVANIVLYNENSGCRPVRCRQRGLSRRSIFAPVLWFGSCSYSLPLEIHTHWVCREAGHMDCKSGGA